MKKHLTNTHNAQDFIISLSADIFCHEINISSFSLFHILDIVTAFHVFLLCFSFPSLSLTIMMMMMIAVLCSCRTSLMNKFSYFCDLPFEGCHLKMYMKFNSPSFIYSELLSFFFLLTADILLFIYKDVENQKAN